MQGVADERPICMRCASPVGVWHHYCERCGAPTGAYTLWLPFEQLRAYCEFLVRAAKAALGRSGLSVLARILSLLLVLMEVPFLLLMLPLGLIGRHRGS